MNNGEIKKVTIAYYSGTGSTKKVADCFEEAFNKSGIQTVKLSVTNHQNISDGAEDLLLLIYAVHAMNAPEAVYRWISSLPTPIKGRAAVISVSGGGDVMPNRACRVSSIKRLQKKGYEVFYDKMLVMPSNWIVETKEPLAVMLLEVLPDRVDQIVNNLLAGTNHKPKLSWIDRIISKLGELEKIGAKEFGKRIKCQDNCTGCGWCSNHCPAENINMDNNRPSFGGKCHMCLNCIYGCPKKALTPGLIKFIVIKNGYNISELEKKVPNQQPVDVIKLTKGYTWLGVRRYLLENKLNT
jgi:Flavodoxins